MTGLLRVRDAAEALGVSPHTIRKWIALQRIEFVRVGAAVRIPARVVQQLIRKGTVRPEKKPDLVA